MPSRSLTIRRLRRLIGDVGHGYSQCAPGFVETLVGTTDPAIAVMLDDALLPLDIPLGAPAGLKTGLAIAAAIQAGIRNADPLLPDGYTEAYRNCSVTFNRKDGYIIRSGSIGNVSAVVVTAPTMHEDVTSMLRLGTAHGGFETAASTDFSDDELGSFLDTALEEQNAALNAGWAWDTMPDSYQNVVIYSAWGTVVDAMLGRAAHFYPQKVASEEVSPNTIFDNLFKLAKWLKDKLDDLVSDVGGSVEVSELVRWCRDTKTFVGDNAYKDKQNVPVINTLLAGEDATSVILEFAEILNLDVKHIFVAYSDEPGVWDKSALTEPTFDDPGESQVAGLASHATLARSLTSAKNTVVKVTGLTAEVPYYFAIQVTDQNGNRYFSAEKSITIPSLPN
jgi:hypothetical protein